MTQSVDLANAINSFVKGCKTDGTWDAIKACCIMAAWDGLTGALYPLKGPAPTNFNFVAGDYNRETGLKGNGSTKYLNSNRNNYDDPQNSNHNAVYVTLLSGPSAILIAAADSTSAGAGSNTLSSIGFSRSRSNTFYATGASITPGFLGHSRSNSASYLLRISGTTETKPQASDPALNASVLLYARQGTVPSYSSDRLSFYSIGESLDLALLDNRVSTLMTDIGAAIP